MTIGASLFLIIVGAILRFAVTARIAGIDLQTVGLILIVGGMLGLVIGLFLLLSVNRRTIGPAEPPRRSDPPAY